MSIAACFMGLPKRTSAKPPERFEDMPVSDEVLSFFIQSRADRPSLFSFKLHPDTGVQRLEPKPQNAPLVALNPLDIRDEIFGGDGPRESRYLFAIDDDAIHVGREAVETISKRGTLTHTNLCPGGAYFGGEVFFLSENQVILTPNSGRYGVSSLPGDQAAHIADHQKRWRATIDCWSMCGFETYLTAADLDKPEQFFRRNWSGRVFAEASADLLAASKP